jgi:surface-anchored protein
MKFNVGSIPTKLVAAFSFFPVFMSAGDSHAVPVYKSGHADIGADYQSATNSFDLFYRFGVDGRSESTPNTDIANSTIPSTGLVVRVPDPSVPRPAGSQWDFLGAAASQPIWFDPQVQEPGKPFLGFATDLLSTANWPSGLTWSLTAILSRPSGGEFSLWQTGFFGSPEVKFDTADGIDPTNDDNFAQSAGGHDHYNWGFTKPGVYQLELTATGTHASNGQASGSGVFTFYVTNAVPEPGGALLALIGMFGLPGFRRGRSRSTCKVEVPPNSDRDSSGFVYEQMILFDQTPVLSA